MKAIIVYCLMFTSYEDIGGVMVSVLIQSAVDCEFKPRSGQAKDYNIGICCFSTKHTAVRRKDWLSWNQDNVSEWGDMSICGLLFQLARAKQIQLSVFVQYKADLIIISSRHGIAEKLPS